MNESLLLETKKFVVRGVIVSITFVMDYLTIATDAAAFNFYIWPVVVKGESRYKLGEPGYRDALCECIEQAIVDIQFVDQWFILALSSGTKIECSTKDEDHVIPEAIELCSKGMWWII